MATDIDAPPLFDILTKRTKDVLSDVWVSWMSNLYQTLFVFFTSRGFFLPNLTTAERDEIQDPSNGQLLYNTTVDAPQFWQTSSASWRTITFT